MAYVDLLQFVLEHTDIPKLNHKLCERAALEIHHSKEGAILFGPSTLGAPLLAATASFRLRCVIAKFREYAADDAYYPRF